MKRWCFSSSFQNRRRDIHLICIIVNTSTTGFIDIDSLTWGRMVCHRYQQASLGTSAVTISRHRLFRPGHLQMPGRRRNGDWDEGSSLPFAARFLEQSGAIPRNCYGLSTFPSVDPMVRCLPVTPMCRTRSDVLYILSDQRICVTTRVPRRVNGLYNFHGLSMNLQSSWIENGSRTRWSPLGSEGAMV